MDLQTSWMRVSERLARAAARAGRSGEEIRLIGVTKGVPAAVVDQALALGLAEVGENRVQEAVPKRRAVIRPATWHFIGHLQRNKVATAVQVFDWIQSVDSVPLAEAIEQAAGRLGKVVPVLLQVNATGDPTRFGVGPEDLPRVFEQVRGFVHLRVEGVMTLAPHQPDPEAARPVFRAARGAWQALRRQAGTSAPLAHCSMGMSHDVEIAIEEGATMVRLGTALFGARGGGRETGGAGR